MRSKSFLVLGLAAVLAVAAATASVYQRQSLHALPATPQALFPGLLEAVNEVVAVRVDLAEGSLTIQKGQ